MPNLPGAPPIAEELFGFKGSPVGDISVRSGRMREIDAVLESPEVRKQPLGSSVVPKGRKPEEMSVRVKSEPVEWRQVIQLSGAKVEQPARPGMGGSAFRLSRRWRALHP